MYKAFILLISLFLSGCASSPAPKDLFWESKEKLELMVANGNSEAAFALGEKYDFASGVKHDTNLAFYWYYFAAKRGHGHAQLRVANRYLNGVGVPKRLYEAYKWYYICSYNGEQWFKSRSKCKNQITIFLTHHFFNASEEGKKYFTHIREEAKNWMPITGP